MQATLKDREMDLKEREAAVDAQLKEAQRILALVNAQAQEVENNAVRSGVMELLDGQAQ